MLYALDSNKIKIPATLKGVGFCPGCQQKLIPRCGKIRVEHWAHYKHSACLFCLYRADNDWSISWKFAFPAEYVEVPVKKSATIEVADICLPNRLIFELWHDSLSLQKASESKSFFKSVVFIIQATNLTDNPSKNGKSLVEIYQNFQPLSGDILGTGFEVSRQLRAVNIPCIYIEGLEASWLLKKHRHLENFDIIYDLGNGLIFWPMFFENWFYVCGILFKKDDFLSEAATLSISL